MKVTEIQRKELLEAAKPLIKWLNENAHPHCHARVSTVDVELLQGVATAGTEEFLKDSEDDARVE